MKRITEEQGLDLIKKFQDKTFINVPINEEGIFSFKQHMQGKQFAYLCETSITEPLSEHSSRIGKLLKVLKPEIDSIGKTPRHFNIKIMMTKDALLQVEEVNALSAFLYDYENIDIKWSAIEIEDEPHTIKMRIITVTE